MKTLFSLSILFLVACSSAPTTSTPPSAPPNPSAAKVARAICLREEFCQPSSFAAAYPNGESQCEDQIVKIAPLQGPCTDAQYTTCAGDITSESCTDLAKQITPTSCSGC